MTRSERSALNKRVHAARRHLVNEDWKTLKGSGVQWRDVWASYEAMPVEDLLELVPACEPVDTINPVVAVSVATLAAEGPVVKGRRGLPGWLVPAHEAYVLARESWEAGLGEAMRGGLTLAEGGKPARGERYPDEERDYRAANPRPVWSVFVKHAAAERRALAGSEGVAA